MTFSRSRGPVVLPGQAHAQQLDAAAMDLALWSRLWTDGGCLKPSELCELILGELASLYLDQGKTESEFVSSMQFGYRSVKAARDAIACVSSVVQPDDG